MRFFFFSTKAFWQLIRYAESCLCFSWLAIAFLEGRVEKHITALVHESFSSYWSTILAFLFHLCSSEGFRGLLKKIQNSGIGLGKVSTRCPPSLPRLQTSGCCKCLLCTASTHMQHKRGRYTCGCWRTGISRAQNKPTDKWSITLEELGCVIALLHRCVFCLVCFFLNGIECKTDLWQKLDAMQNQYVLVLACLIRTVKAKHSFMLSPAWLQCLWFVSSVLLLLSFCP